MLSLSYIRTSVLDDCGRWCYSNGENNDNRLYLTVVGWKSKIGVVLKYQ